MLALPRPPQQLGRYEIVERLSAGGMGEVFLARFAGPGGFLKPVALKRIHPHLANDETFLHMLHDEANVTVAIKHPNVVQILEVGSEGGSHFMVLNYVSGETLSKLRRELVRQEMEMPTWLVAWIGAEIASALHAAHEARSLDGEPLDIIHRDVSLGNIMLGDDGRPMLFDFGVAKARQRLAQTNAGELKGKIAYMAPEIFRGAAVDRTVDIFALGVVLYELLTGRSPYQRESELETIAALQVGEVTPPAQVRAEVDECLSAIVMQAMARERCNRFPTAQQVEDALRGWARQRGEPHNAVAAQNWLQEHFASRLQERQALLMRVASRQPLPLQQPSPDLLGSTSATTRTPAPTPLPASWGLQETTAAPSRSQSRWLWVGGAGATVLMVLLGFWLGRSQAPAAAPQVPASSPLITSTSSGTTTEVTSSASAPASSSTTLPSRSALPARNAEPPRSKGAPPSRMAPSPSPRRTPGLHTID
ncbi:MAG: serine/threonine-protein kinase [Myxococcales bacterium]|nr:serine/threonine protein kinase [Polyangiaceae bacterium]MDW8251047.1 serine/threonine-protein kinase [Myxococcales bacterium]